MKPTAQKNPNPKSKAPTCRVCGCTDDKACPGGCYWVEPDLCSQCKDILISLGRLKGFIHFHRKCWKNLRKMLKKNRIPAESTIKRYMELCGKATGDWKKIRRFINGK